MGVEAPECRTCPNRERCHGLRPDVTRETVLRLVHDALREVLAERGHAVAQGAGGCQAQPPSGQNVTPRLPPRKVSSM